MTSSIPSGSDAPVRREVRVQCLSCGREGTLDGLDARVAGRPLVELTRRLVCSACGSRAVKAVSARTPRDLAARGRKGSPGGAARPERDPDAPDQCPTDLASRVR